MSHDCSWCRGELRELYATAAAVHRVAMASLPASTSKAVVAKLGELRVALDACESSLGAHYRAVDEG